MYCVHARKRASRAPLRTIQIAESHFVYLPCPPSQILLAPLRVATGGGQSDDHVRLGREVPYCMQLDLWFDGLSQLV